MKSLIPQRILAVFLCMALALGLTACGGNPPQPEESEKESMAGAPRDRGEEKDGKTASVAGSDAGKASLAQLYGAMAYDDQYAGATVYLGYREQGDPAPLSDWMQENWADLVEAMPFLLEIPPERILGPGYGDVYCIVPRDENTTLTVNHVKWVPSQFEVGEVVDKVLYQEKGAAPVLVFVNFEDHDMPDIHVTLETDDGPMCGWFPEVDEYGAPRIPGDPEAPMLMDFGIWGCTTGLDFPENGVVVDEWWTPPTDWELGATGWYCGQWYMQLNWCDGDPEYSGTVELYHQTAGQNYELAYFGDWRMEDDCIWLHLFDGACYFVEGLFPILIDPASENIYIQQDEQTGVGQLPFLEEGMTYAYLTRYYG